MATPSGPPRRPMLPVSLLTNLALFVLDHEGDAELWGDS